MSHFTPKRLTKIAIIFRFLKEIKIYQYTNTVSDFVAHCLGSAILEWGRLGRKHATISVNRAVLTAGYAYPTDRSSNNQSKKIIILYKNNNCVYKRSRKFLRKHPLSAMCMSASFKVSSRAILFGQ